MKRQFKHNLSDAEIRSIFMDEMRSHGLIFEEKDYPINMDGRTHYVRVEGRSRAKKNQRSGWYSGHLGDFPNGCFGWLHGDNPLYKWSLYKHLKDKNGSVDFVELTEEEVKQREVDRERELRKRQLEDKRRFDFSKAYTIIEWERALPLTMHPYLNKKKFSLNEIAPYARIYNQKDFTASEIKAILDQHFPEYNKPSNIRKLIDYQIENISYRGFNLLIKGQMIDTTPIMLQMIFNKKSKSGKDKHFPKELIKQGSFHNLGKRYEAGSKGVLLCEGWATGISLLRFTSGKVPILVAWDSGNIRSVAIELRKQNPNIKIFVAIDNDHTNSIEKNAGVRGGLKTCYAVGAHIVTPPFNTDDPAHKSLSDWNDIDSIYSPQVSSGIFWENFLNSELIPAVFDPSLELLSNDHFIAPNYDPDIQLKNSFSQHWAALIHLTSQGLQHCEYKEDQQLEMYQAELSKVALYFKENNLSSFNRTYDINMDYTISKLFFNFSNSLHLSHDHIMSEDELFKSILNKIKSLQLYTPDVNLLINLRDSVAETYSLETANLCMSLYLSKNNHFDQSHENWCKDLIKEAFNRDNSLSLPLFIPLAIQMKQVKFWEKHQKQDRIKTACDEILRIYDTYINDGEVLNSVEHQNQFSKLSYINGAHAKYLLSNDPNDQAYLMKLIGRFNQVEKSPIDQNNLPLSL